MVSDAPRLLLDPVLGVLVPVTAVVLGWLALGAGDPRTAVLVCWSVMAAGDLVLFVLARRVSRRPGTAPAARRFWRAAAAAGTSTTRTAARPATRSCGTSPGA